MTKTEKKAAATARAEAKAEADRLDEARNDKKDKKKQDKASKSSSENKGKNKNKTYFAETEDVVDSFDALEVDADERDLNSVLESYCYDAGDDEDIIECHLTVSRREALFGPNA